MKKNQKVTADCQQRAAEPCSLYHKCTEGELAWSFW